MTVGHCREFIIGMFVGCVIAGFLWTLFMRRRVP